ILNYAVYPLTGDDMCSMHSHEYHRGERRFTRDERSETGRELGVDVGDLGVSRERRGLPRPEREELSLVALRGLRAEGAGGPVLRRERGDRIRVLDVTHGAVRDAAGQSAAHRTREHGAVVGGRADG